MRQYLRYISIIFFVNGYLFAQVNDAWQSDITVTNQISINTEFTDFAPSYWNEYIVFSSSKKRQRIFDPNTKEAFFDLYIAGVNNNNELERSAQLSKVLNSNYHEAASCFSDDGSHIYFSRMDEEGYMQIYESDFENGEWIEPTLSSLNENESESLHPSISIDNATIFFSSNRSGGYGGMDLYSSKLEDGIWSEPLNLGPQINTEGNDIFPFITQNGFLIFSSDGHKKNADLDILKVNMSQDQLQVVRLPEPINSEHDDLSFICDYQGKTGYFSSNRPGGIGKDDIYQFTSIESILGYGESSYNIITIYAKNEDEEPLSDVIIRYRYLAEDETILFNKSVFDMTDAPYDSVWVDKSGRAQFKLNDGYTIIEADAEHKEKWQVAVTNKLKNKTLDIVLKDEEIIDEKANIILPLPEKTNESKIIKEDLNVGTVLVFDNIYYDYNSHEIKKGAADELDQLSVVMKENLNLKIQLSAHTDSRGKDDYNLLLSEKRAVSAKQYLIKKGISSNRIFTIGYGERNLRNHCKDGVLCSEDDHLYNRRTEVKILEN